MIISAICMLNLSKKYSLCGIIWHLQCYFCDFFSAVGVRSDIQITLAASDKELPIEQISCL